MMTQGFKYIKSLYEKMEQNHNKSETWKFEVYNINFNNEQSLTAEAIKY